MSEWRDAGPKNFDDIIDLKISTDGIVVMTITASEYSSVRLDMDEGNINYFVSRLERARDAAKLMKKDEQDE